jgi:hypothetical protein
VSSFVSAARTLISAARTRAIRRRVLVVGSGAAALSIGAVFTLTGAAQAPGQSTHFQPGYLKPAPYSQPLQAWSGNVLGQTASPASNVSVLCHGTTAYVSVDLVRTNQRHVAFEPAFLLDSGSWTWVPASDFTTDWAGSGSTRFTIHDVAAGDHQVGIDINDTPYPGSTYYLNGTRNNNGSGGIYFACPPSS